MGSKGKGWCCFGLVPRLSSYTAPSEVALCSSAAVVVVQRSPTRLSLHNSGQGALSNVTLKFCLCCFNGIVQRRPLWRDDFALHR